MTPLAAAEGARRRSAARFALFAECLPTGVWRVVAALLPLVTALPAFAAACGPLRRHLHGERSTWHDFAAAGGRTLVWWGGLALLGLDLAVARSGVSVLAPVALVVTGLRTGVLWRSGEGGRGGRAAACGWVVVAVRIVRRPTPGGE
ncbi:hypothetical protein [Actinacidiphila glaucinigra]|uniref:hypothetical protein n=1 Tax=Actinacidiphila glaucinigra TaxID=235986 RepID=UPI0036EB0705